MAATKHITKRAKKEAKKAKKAKREAWENLPQDQWTEARKKYIKPETK